MISSSPFPTSPLRLLMVLTEFPPAVGGMQTHAEYLTKYLRARGHKLEVYTYQGASASQREEAPAFDHSLGVPVHRRLSRLSYWYSVDLLAKAVRDFRPDLVYSSTTFYGNLQPLCDVPVVCRSVGNDVMRPWIAYPFHLGSWLLSRWFLERPLFDLFRKLRTPEYVEALFRHRRFRLMSEAARAATQVLANSEFTRGLLQEIGVSRDRVQLLVGGVDAARFGEVSRDRAAAARHQLGIPPTRTVLLTACRLVDKKGVDFLLDSFARFEPARRDWHLVVVGRGRRAGRLRAHARELGLDSHVTFTGSVPHGSIHEYFALADVFVLASRVYEHVGTGLRDAETMGRVLCEANAAGVPVVAADSGGIPSVIEHEYNGLLFRPDDADDLLLQLEQILRYPEMARTLAERGRRIARTRFDWSLVLAQQERSFYRALGVSEVGDAASDKYEAPVAAVVPA